MEAVLAEQPGPTPKPRQTLPPAGARVDAGEGLKEAQANGRKEGQLAGGGEGEVFARSQPQPGRGLEEPRSSKGLPGGHLGSGGDAGYARPASSGSPLAGSRRAVEEAGSSPGSRRPRILLGVSGSVAAIKVPELVSRLERLGSVEVVSTQAAQRFFGPGIEEAQEALEGLTVHDDEDEWREWEAIGDEIMHIELRKRSDVLVIAPLSANTLAKLANGLCDNLLTCVVRAWDWAKPLLVAPAMNTYMWDSPLTRRHLATLAELGATVIPPVSKALACGDVGAGAMASPLDITQAVTDALAHASQLPAAEKEAQAGQLPAKEEEAQPAAAS